MRDVPEDVAESLKARAAASGRSLNGYVNAELLEQIRERIPAEGPGRIDIVAAVHHERR
ncbi:MAG TPA: antitoxin [Candidatus Brachybacterium merdigallinarum]|nr:antitoxin [Candidatus Brachybacterium merdigallinarum]